MNAQILWHLFLKVKSRDKAERVMARFIEQVGQPLTVCRCERYWKDSSLFDVTLTAPLAVESVSLAMSEILMICFRVSDRWNIGPLQFYENEKWEFEGIAAVKDSIRIQGLTWAHFDAGNIFSPLPMAVVDEAVASTN